jgi:hypothetical protein
MVLIGIYHESLGIVINALYLNTTNATDLMVTGVGKHQMFQLLIYFM